MSKTCFRKTSHRGFVIAARICLDAKETSEDLKDAILCVPAHLRRESPIDIAEHWKGRVKTLVVANSSDVHPSLLDVGGEWEFSCANPPPTSTPHHYSAVRFAQLPT